MSISDKYATRRIVELKSLLAVNKEIQAYIKQQADNEVSLTAAIVADDEASITQEMNHVSVQNQGIPLSEDACRSSLRGIP